MRRLGRTGESYSSRDDLNRLVVRDIVRLSLCKETSLLNPVSGDGSTSAANTASFSPREHILTFFRLKALAVLRDLRSFRFLLPILLLTPEVAQAQTAPPPSGEIQRERVEQLQELLRTKKDLQASQQAMQQQLAEFDARIAALEASLGVTPSQDEQPQANSDATASTAAVASPDGMVYAKTSDPGPYEPGAPGGMGYKGSPMLRKPNRVPFPTNSVKASFSLADLTGRSTSPPRAMYAT